MLKDVKVIKKDGTIEDFDAQKIVKAVGKSADRIMIKFTEEENQKIVSRIETEITMRNLSQIPIAEMHKMVECALEEVSPVVCKSYRDYRNYKKEFVHMLDDVYRKSMSIRYIGDKDNANTDSALVATKRSLIFNELNKQLYRKFFMTAEELQASRDGYIYVHDQSARLDTMNCFSRDTKFITDRGVKSFYDFTEGDTVNVISHKGIWRKAVVHSYGWQNVQKIKLKRATGKEKEITVTPNHRWILKDGTETTELKIGDKLCETPNIVDFDFDKLSHDNKKIWCLGFAYADGSVVSDNNISTMHVRLCNDKIKYAERFESVGYHVTQPKSLNGDKMVRMIDVHSKDFPLYLINKNNVTYFINGFLTADGGRNKENHNSEFRTLQVTGEMNKYMYDLLNMAGYYVTSIRDLTGQETNYGIRQKETINYQIYSDCGNRTWYVTDIVPEKINPNSEVWCLDVEEDHSFLLEGGIPTGNCCLFDAENVMRGGFEMGNIWYNEPKTLDVAFDVIGDIVLSSAAQQYGGFTIPEIDKVLAYYAEKSYKMYYEQFTRNQKQTLAIIGKSFKDLTSAELGLMKQNAEEFALSSVRRDYEQGWQGIEYKLNTVGSSRGDYPFVTVTFGLGTSRFEKMCSIVALRNHAGGQGKKGHKVPVLFPKYVFLYDENLHGPGCENEDVFEEGIKCSSKAMYPKKIGAYISNNIRKPCEPRNLGCTLYA